MGNAMPPRQTKPVLRNFSYNLTDKDLAFICSRLHYNYQDDLSDVCNFLSLAQTENVEVIRGWLESAESSGDFYSVVDEIKSSVDKEFERRGGKFTEII
jgi:hypothetical protein